MTLPKHFLFAALLIQTAAGQPVQPDADPVEPAAPATQSDASAEPTSQDAALPGQWEELTITDERLKERGYLSVAGAQWFRSMAIAPGDGDFMLWGTDVGGLFRTLDGGANWEPANVGYDSRGTSALAIDPNNSDRVVAVGGNSAAHPFNGIYVSSDRAASWERAMEVDQSANREVGRASLAFDASTRDESLGGSRVVYWSQPATDVPMFGATTTVPGGLWRSEDGGTSWAHVDGSEVAEGAHLSVHPTSGVIVAANLGGVHRSSDEGASWKTVLAGQATGISSPAGAPDEVWVSLQDSIWVSRDAGLNWERVTGADSLAGADGELHNIAVSPVDPTRLVVGRKAPDYDYARFFSHDGGATWQRASVARDDNLIPSNARTGCFVWHPSDADIILSSGGDYPTLSRDGGQSYARAGNGVSNVLVGGAFSFSASNPDVISLGLQDYGLLHSTDGGKTWAYSSPGGHVWGGFNYAAYSPDGTVIIVGDAEFWGTPKRLTLSKDAGESWSRLPFEMKDEPLAATGSPGDPDVLFFGPYRSADRGASWAEMEGATRVLNWNGPDGKLLGIDQSKLQGVNDAVVVSADDGASWERLFASDGTIQDVAWDDAAGVVFVVVNNRLRMWTDGDYLADPVLPHDQQGGPRVRSVATDPNVPGRVYVAANRDVINSSASAMLSDDGGTTWTNLTRTTPLDGSIQDGGREAQWVRVHPVSGEAWFATGCYGVWKWIPSAAPTRDAPAP